MGDVDPTGDRTYQGDDQPKVYFADLRHEVDLAARRHAEMSTALDIYADELSHIAFAVAGDRSGTIEFDQIVDHVKAVVVERDRLRAVCDAVGAESILDVVTERNRLRAVADEQEEQVRTLAGVGEWCAADRDRLRAVVDAYHTGLSMVIAVTDIDIAHGYAQAALDVSPTIGGMTPAEAYEFYADPANQEPQGPPVRRHGNRTPDTGETER